jgi:hypothetical protein
VKSKVQVKNMVQVKNVQRVTVKKVLKALKESGHALSMFAIREEANTSFDSAKAAVEVLMSEGKVVELSTSNGLFYICSGNIGDSKC